MAPASHPGKDGSTIPAYDTENPRSCLIHHLLPREGPPHVSGKPPSARRQTAERRGNPRSVGEPGPGHGAGTVVQAEQEVDETGLVGHELAGDGHGDDIVAGGPAHSLDLTFLEL